MIKILLFSFLITAVSFANADVETIHFKHSTYIVNQLSHLDRVVNGLIYTLEKSFIKEGETAPLSKNEKHMISNKFKNIDAALQMIQSHSRLARDEFLASGYSKSAISMEIIATRCQSLLDSLSVDRKNVLDWTYRFSPFRFLKSLRFSIANLGGYFFSSFELDLDNSEKGLETLVKAIMVFARGKTGIDHALPGAGERRILYAIGNQIQVVPEADVHLSTADAIEGERLILANQSKHMSDLEALESVDRWYKHNIVYRRLHTCSKTLE